MKLKRNQLIDLHSKFECKEWKIEIEFILKSDVISEEIDVTNHISKLYERGTPEQIKICEELGVTKPLEYVPYDTYEEKVELVGKIVKHKGTGNVHLIRSFYRILDEVYVNDYFDFNILLEEFTFLDGSPCGKIKETK